MLSEFVYFSSSTLLHEAKIHDHDRNWYIFNMQSIAFVCFSTVYAFCNHCVEYAVTRALNYILHSTAVKQLIVKQRKKEKKLMNWDTMMKYRKLNSLFASYWRPYDFFLLHLKYALESEITIVEMGIGLRNLNCIRIK